jgi:solute carrier family 26 (sodium-independent sulfate anion transporter), member 11
MDVVVFVIGLTITLVNSIENGVYAMIALSLIILLFRTFQAQGSFLGSVNIRTFHGTPPNGSPASHSQTNEKLEGVQYREALDDASRKVFLPLNRQDGSNPQIPLEAPDPGIFIYRLKEGFNYTNCGKQLDDMVAVITSQTRRGQPPKFERPGVSSSLGTDEDILLMMYRIDLGLILMTQTQKMVTSTQNHDWRRLY